MTTTTLLIVAGVGLAGLIALGLLALGGLALWWFWPRPTAQTKAAKHQADVARELFEAGCHDQASEAFGFAVKLQQVATEVRP